LHDGTELWPGDELTLRQPDCYPEPGISPMVLKVQDVDGFLRPDGTMHGDGHGCDWVVLVGTEKNLDQPDLRGRLLTRRAAVRVEAIGRSRTFPKPPPGTLQRQPVAVAPGRRWRRG
jgi:hypothetical protein